MKKLMILLALTVIIGLTIAEAVPRPPDSIYNECKVKNSQTGETFWGKNITLPWISSNKLNMLNYPFTEPTVPSSIHPDLCGPSVSGYSGLCPIDAHLHHERVIHPVPSWAMVASTTPNKPYFMDPTYYDLKDEDKWLCCVEGNEIVDLSNFRDAEGSWNMIPNPCCKDMALDETVFTYNSEGDKVYYPIEKAYWYNPEINTYEPVTGHFEPVKSYWVFTTLNEDELANSGIPRESQWHIQCREGEMPLNTKGSENKMTIGEMLNKEIEMVQNIEKIKTKDAQIGTAVNNLIDHNPTLITGYADEVACCAQCVLDGNYPGCACCNAAQ